ncbi:PREDICTED: uncharacterized protein LOC109585392 [Amphimedon queenslandica]|uniref:Uncharacterized protein n=1 Tax=Amphimedon queenslandica TaxID=400682 RepID=A0AAN0JJS4_AMPQE|nr:PREDICTED: uncharacterized protein LOC109585392 [Amphimedon queenslandica]|eukprot:XP_019857017.1 PREDICTED: uncharacterized protein LOC109585392 [Amphimedon queenslandica]
MVDGSANRMFHREGNEASEIHPVFTSRTTSGPSEQSSKVDGNELVIVNEKLEEVLQEKQIITEDNEKLRATVAYNEVYIIEIEEEKKQVEEEMRKVEDENKRAKKEKKHAEEEKRQLEEQYLIDKQITKELKTKVVINEVYITQLDEEKEKVEKQYLKEKQITKELKTKVADNELHTAKLMKEREQWSQVKETSTIGLQFNYLIPSMGKSIIRRNPVLDTKLATVLNLTLRFSARGRPRLTSTTPAVKHPQFQYDQTKDGRVQTNEQLLYNLSNGQFTVPSVSGQCCPPTSDFTINKINQNKGIMLGGLVTNDGLNTATNSVYIFNVTHNTIHWESIKRGSISGEGLWTKERFNHACAIISSDSSSPALVVIGGRDNNNQLVTECLLFDDITTGQFSCKKIPLPDCVTGRYYHSLTAVTMSPHCVWLVIVGGGEEVVWEDIGGGVEKPVNTFITDTNGLTMIIELVYIEAGEWIVQSVLDGNDLTSKKYQEKYSTYSKTRTWWMDQLIEYPTEKEMKLQRYIQSLHQELQVAHQNKVSLQEALTEANKQANFDKIETVKSEKLEEVLKAQAQLQEEKQIITEDYEKLKAKVGDYEIYITEIEEEKRQVEEKYLQEKQITKECIDEFKASLSFKRTLPKVEEHCQKFLNSFIANIATSIRTITPIITVKATKTITRSTDNETDDGVREGEDVGLEIKSSTIKK